MRTYWLLVTFLALMSLLAFGQAQRADPISGTWTAEMVNPDASPRALGTLRGFPTTLMLKASGSTLAGTARMGNWPGTARITGGTIVGDRISFSMVGELEYCISGNGYRQCAAPTMECEGVIAGDEIKLTLTLYQPSPIKMELKGQRFSE